MAASPATSSSRRSPGSSSASLRRSDDHPADPAISIDTLVNHLLVSKRSLSSMNLVLRANELVTAARAAHEESALLAAQTGFIRSSVADQIAILARVRRALHATYEWGKRDFKTLIRAMDEVDAQLGATMKMLRGTDVQGALQPAGEDRRNLLDFVDENSVHGMRDAMKKSIQELQGIQQSFDGDLLRFETDIRNLKKIMNDSAPAATTTATSTTASITTTTTTTTPDDLDNSAATRTPMIDLLLSMDDHSSAMAQLLTSLTKHFDLCVTAIRTTEGAVAVARRRAAEVTQSQEGSDGVSISGLIAEQESHMSDLEPKTAQDRAEMLKVVTQDADEVDDVVSEIHERLAAMEAEHAALQDHACDAAAAYDRVLATVAALEDVGDRLADYMAAEGDFRARWDLEKDVVFAKLREMKDMRDFYEGYASAYGSMVLEAERRRAVDRQVEAHWRKAQEAADRLLEADRAARESFRAEVGEFLPTDLWAAVQAPAKAWRVVQVRDGDGAGAVEGALATSATEK